MTSEQETRSRSEGLLRRMSPVLKLAIAIAWLAGMATTARPGPPLALAGAAVLGGLVLGPIAPRRLIVRIAPLLLVALAVALANTVFAASNLDPAAPEVARIGPLRLTEPALRGGAGLAARVLAIVTVGAVFTLTTNPTRLVDSLVQQARVSPRFAYGALAAYQAAPRLAGDLRVLRGARRLRGLRLAWHPRVFVGLLIRAIRHADQLAVAMDARGFGRGPRTSFRPIAWGWPDAVVAAGAALALVGVLALAR